MKDIRKGGGIVEIEDGTLREVAEASWETLLGWSAGAYVAYFEDHLVHLSFEEEITATHIG